MSANQSANTNQSTSTKTPTQSNTKPAPKTKKEQRQQAKEKAEKQKQDARKRYTTKRNFIKNIQSLKQDFQDIKDPRRRQDMVQHLLMDIILISILAIFAGAEGPTAIERWAKGNAKHLKKFLQLPNGIPSHDRINIVLQTIDPKQFQNCFLGWIKRVVLAAQEIAVLADGQDPDEAREHIAIDGKLRRRSASKTKNLGAMDVVSAWSTKNSLSLGQVAADEKSNEITAIPKLLKILDIRDTVISIDAAGTQKNIAKQIIIGGGNYVLALKGNQGNLHNAVQDFFEQTDLTSSEIHYYRQDDKGHGRIELREYYLAKIPDKFAESDKWFGLSTIGMVRRTYTTVGSNETKSDVRYFISSLSCNVKLFAKYVHNHWGIENSLHWVLDMVFREDESQVRNRNLAENLSWLNRVAISLLKQHPEKTSIKLKQKSCAWDFNFLIQVITGIHN